MAVVVPVASENLPGFLNYCRAHGPEHDESYLPGRDFQPGPEFPSFVLTEDAAIAGAACLILEKSMVARGIARVAILHALTPSRPAYAALIDALRPHLAGLGYAYLFIPRELTAVREIWEGLGMTVLRTAYLFKHRSDAPPPIVLPAGFHFEPVTLDTPKRIQAICDLTNLSFAGRPQRVDNTPESIRKELEADYNIAGGMLLLYDGERPVGTVHVSADDEAGASFIDMLTVHPDYRGQGLGRVLTRQAIAFSHGHGLPAVYLSVAAENESALRLYLSEGFIEWKVMVCYRVDDEQRQSSSLHNE
jgi:mycothiol synthase